MPCLRSFLVVWLVALSGPLSANVIEQEQETWRRINLAGTQRMMVELIERSVCYVMTGIETDRFATEAATAADRFETQLHALLEGDDAFGLQREDSAEVRAKLDLVQSGWAQFGPVARQIMSGDTHSVPVRQLIEMDGHVLSLVEQAAQEIETVHKDRLIARKSLATTINIASRQQMLAVRIAKAFCYVALDLNRDSMMEEMRADMETFEVALKAMESGDYDMQVIDPPSLAALMTVSNMWDAWRALLPDLELSMTDPDLASESLLSVAEQSAALSELAEAMVQVYLK